MESIRFRTDEPYELIVVDNGSTDGTPERLRDMPDVTLIANRENRGFPAGVNQGIAAARGRQVFWSVLSPTTPAVIRKSLPVTPIWTLSTASPGNTANNTPGTRKTSIA